MRDCQISVIVSTYNWPEALRAVLLGLKSQTCRAFEIIIADDGSTEKTHQLIKTLKKHIPVPVQHVYQEDRGFRVAAIRNKAILQAKADYILFLDGDCIPPPRFIQSHLALREQGYFVTGNRVLLSEDFTLKVLSEDLRIESWPWWRFGLARFSGHCNRFMPFMRLPLGPLRRLKPHRWQGAMGCHLGIWRKDLFYVNGWEEKYEGWGYEDSDLVIRLIQAGIHRKEARFSVPLIHLWHPIRSRDHAEKNWALLNMQQRRQSAESEADEKTHTGKRKQFEAEKGLHQVLEQPMTELPHTKTATHSGGG